MNPYLACAAQLAAGLTGIEEGLTLDAPLTGDLYGMSGVPTLPHTLRDATDALQSSAMLRRVLGDDVVDHYVRAAQVEQEDFDRVVTDYEVARGFERA
jgi:glutamine synthetase